MMDLRNALVGALALFSVVVAAPALADESDNFTCRGRLSSDALAPLDAWINARINDAMAAANTAGSKPCDAGCLVKLLQDRVGQSHHKSTLVPESRLVQWAKSDPGIERCHLQLRDTIYGARAYDKPLLFPFLHRIIFVLDSIQLSGRVVGLDKLDHFIREGLDHWRRTQAGSTITESMAYEIGSPDKHLKWTEYGLKGTGLTGVFAYADLAAGYFGYRFWQRLLTIDGPDGYIQRDAKGQYTRRRTFTFADYVNDAWDEAINCSTFTPALEREVTAALEERHMQCRPTPSLATLPEAKLYVNPKALVLFLENPAHNFPLFGDELLNARVRECQQRVELAAIEGLGFSRALQLDEAAVRCLDDVHVHFRAGIFLVGQIDHRHAVDDPDAGRGDVVGDRDA